MAASLGELFVELGVFADTKELKNFEKKLKQINTTIKETKQKNNEATKSSKDFLKSVAGIATAVTAAVWALQKMTDSLVAQNQEFLNLTRTTDIALGTFQKWNNVGRMFGVKNAAQQIANLNEKIFEARLTGQGAEGFIFAGVDYLNQDAEGVLEQLRSMVAGLDDTKASYLLNRIGIDPAMLHLLRMTRKEFEAFDAQTRKYRLTEEQTKYIQKMNAQLEIARMKIQYMKDQALIAILPYMERFYNSLAEMTERLMHFIKWLSSNDKFAGFIRFILKAIATFTIFAVTISTLIKTFAFLKTAILGVRAALLLLTAHPLVAALTALTAVLAFALQHYSEGGAGRPGTQRSGMFGLPNMSPMNQNIDNRKYLTNTRNRNQQITMNNIINTTEAAQAVSDELAYYQYATYGYSY